MITLNEIMQGLDAANTREMLEEIQHVFGADDADRFNTRLRATAEEAGCRVIERVIVGSTGGALSALDALFLTGMTAGFYIAREIQDTVVP